MEHFETLKEVGIPLEPIWDDEVLQAVEELPENIREQVRELLSWVYPAQAPFSQVDVAHALQAVQHLTRMVNYCQEYEKNCEIMEEEEDTELDLPSVDMMKRLLKHLDPLRVCCFPAHCKGCYEEWKQTVMNTLEDHPHQVVFGKYKEAIGECAGYSIACLEKASQEAMAPKILHYYVHLAQFCICVHFQKEAVKQLNNNTL